MPYIEIKPAYGRDYKSQAEVRKAWNSNVDFQLTDTGQYINKADFEKYSTRKESIIVRYGNLRKVMSV